MKPDGVDMGSNRQENKAKYDLDKEENYGWITLLIRISNWGDSDESAAENTGMEKRMCRRLIEGYYVTI